MAGTGKVDRFLAVWITVPIFLGYSTYFFPYSLKSFFSPITMIAVSVFFYILFSFLTKPRFNFVPELRILIFFFLVLFIGLLYTNALKYGSDKLNILFAWVFLFYLYGFIIINNFDLFVKATFFSGAVFLFLLFNKFGDPITFFKSMQGEIVRLGVTKSDDNEDYLLNPIWVARYLGFLFLIALYSLKKGKINYLTYAYLLCIFLYMITSGSKGPIFALIVASLIFFADSRLSKNMRNIIIFIFICLGVLVLLNFIDFFSSSFFISRFSGESSSGAEREDLIGVALEYRGLGSFFWGTGTGNFGYIMSQRDTRAYPHNIFAELYCENGIIGASFILVMLYSVVRKYTLIFKNRTLKLLCALFIFFFLNALFSGDLFSNEYLFIFFILFHYEAKMVTKEEEFMLMLNTA